MYRILISSAVFVAVAFMSASATIRYVPSDDYPTIQEGIDACNNGDTVLVMPGLYVECINFSGHNIVVGSLFLITSDTSYVSSTIIDGDYSCTVVTFENGEDNMASIVGFKIQNGYGDPDGGGIYCGNYSNPYINTNIIIGNSADSSGGGIYCWNHSNPAIANNTISANSGKFGGGISCDGASSPMITNNAIIDNSAYFSGGGVRCEQASTNPVISNNTISLNDAEFKGGGIDCDEYSEPEISGNIIEMNTAVEGGGISCRTQSNPEINYNVIRENVAVGNDGKGGGINCADSDPFITNNTIIENSADFSGGGINCFGANPLISNNTISGNSTSENPAIWWGIGGGINCLDYSNPHIINNRIRENTSTAGGGIMADVNCNPIIESNIIDSNTTSTSGGGIHCGDDSNPQINNNLIIGNIADTLGGGIYCFDSSPAIINNTISANSAGPSGGGIYCKSVSNPEIKNTIFWADSASYESEIDFDDSSSPIITYCDIQGGWGDPPDSNINADPLFADPVNGDFHLTWAHFPVDDSTKSPCIDSGDPQPPLDPDTTRADIGAFYFDQSQTGIINDLPTAYQFYLRQSYPNPFNAQTAIEYVLPFPSHVTINIYDILGRKVETLIDGHQPAGAHSIIWDAQGVSSGIYFYKIEAGEYVESKNCLLLK